MTRKPSTCSLPAALLMERGMTPSSSFDGSFISPTGSTCSLDILGPSSSGGGVPGATTRTLTPSHAHRYPPSSSSHPHTGDNGGSRRHSRSECVMPAPPPPSAAAASEGSPVITSMDTAIVKAVPIAKPTGVDSFGNGGGDSSINGSVSTSGSPSSSQNKSASSSKHQPSAAKLSTSSSSPDGGSRLSHASSSGRGSRQSDGNASWADQGVPSEEAVLINKPDWAQMPDINGEVRPSPHPSPSSSSSSHTQHQHSSSPSSHPHTHHPSHPPHSRQQHTPVPSKRNAILDPDSSTQMSTTHSSPALYREHNSTSSIITVPQPVLAARNTSSTATVAPNWTAGIVQQQQQHQQQQQQQHPQNCVKFVRTSNPQSISYVPYVTVMNGLMPSPSPQQLSAQRVPPQPPHPHHPHTFVMAGGLVVSPSHQPQAAAVSSVRGGGGGGGGGRGGATSCFNCGKGGHLGHTCPGVPMETVCEYIYIHVTLYGLYVTDR